MIDSVEENEALTDQQKLFCLYYIHFQTAAVILSQWSLLNSFYSPVRYTIMAVYGK